PLQEFLERKLLRRLRRAVVQDPHHYDGVGVDVQAQFDALMFLARGLLRANFGVICCLLIHIVGGCSLFEDARQLLMSSPKRKRVCWRSLALSKAWLKVRT